MNSKHTLVRDHARSYARQLFVVLFLGLGFLQPAHADYIGRDAVFWAAQYIFIGCSLISLIVCGFCAIWRQDHLMKGVYSFIASLVLLFLVKSSDYLANLLARQLQ
jgi:hypothetical protein